MCLAGKHVVLHFSVHLGFLGWAGCPRQSTNTVFGIFLLTDTNTINSRVLAKSSLRSSKLLKSRNVVCHLCSVGGVFGLLRVAYSTSLELDPCLGGACSLWFRCVQGTCGVASIASNYFHIKWTCSFLHWVLQGKAFLITSQCRLGSIKRGKDSCSALLLWTHSLLPLSYLASNCRITYLHLASSVCC